MCFYNNSFVQMPKSITGCPFVQDFNFGGGVMPIEFSNAILFFNFMFKIRLIVKNLNTAPFSDTRETTCNGPGFRNGGFLHNGQFLCDAIRILPVSVSVEATF